MPHAAHALGGRHPLRPGQVVPQGRVRVPREPRAPRRPVERLGPLRGVLAQLRGRHQEEVQGVRQPGAQERRQLLRRREGEIQELRDEGVSTGIERLPVSRRTTYIQPSSPAGF
jgi:hypothetical protein